MRMSRPAFLSCLWRSQVDCDYSSLGLSLKAHPLSFVRPELNRLKVVSAAALAESPNNAIVRVAGLVLVRQQPSTAKGTVFVTLEDETGIVNLIVRPQRLAALPPRRQSGGNPDGLGATPACPRRHPCLRDQARATSRT